MASARERKVKSDNGKSFLSDGASQGFGYVE
jgi:hypothetical protein